MATALGPHAPIGLAVQASASIPGVFRPVEHADRRYIGGAVAKERATQRVVRHSVEYSFACYLFAASKINGDSPVGRGPSGIITFLKCIE